MYAGIQIYAIIQGMAKLKFPNIVEARDALEQIMGHGQAVTSAAHDLVAEIHSHDNRGRKMAGIAINTITLTGEALSAFDNLKALTHPHLIKD